MPATLPRDLQTALHALAGDSTLAQLIGPAFVEQFLLCKQDEWDAYAGHVSDWEMQRYTLG